MSAQATACAPAPGSVSEICNASGFPPFMRAQREAGTVPGDFGSTVSPFSAFPRSLDSFTIQ